MTQPQEQRAQYAGTAPPEGTALVLKRRTAPRMTQEPDALVSQTGEHPQVFIRRSAKPDLDELENETLYPQRVPSSTRRYAPVADPKGQTRVRVQHHGAPMQRRVSQDYPFQYPLQDRPHQQPGPSSRILRPGPHWLRFVGGGMLFMFFGWVALSNVTSWWMTTQDDWHYGRPRTYQVDATVGHLDSVLNPSHFTVENFNRHVVIIEFQGGDPSKAVSYVGPTLIGPGQDLTPATVSFRDLNRDGKSDMILQLQDNHLVFVNTGKAFRLATPADHVTL